MKAKISSKERLHACPVPLIGLTGSIATGKSTVANLLRQKNLPLICADHLVKKIYQSPEALQFIQANFPQVLTHPINSQIDFPKLRAEVFTYPDKKLLVENFIYQRMPAEFFREVQLLSQQNSPLDYLIYDVPLLFEKDLKEKFDFIICVYCKPEVQLQRLVERDKIPMELAKTMVQSQLSPEWKKDHSNYVIMNESSLEDLKKAVDLMVDQIINP